MARPLKSTISDPHFQRHRKRTMTCSKRWCTVLFRAMGEWQTATCRKRAVLLTGNIWFVWVMLQEPLSEWLYNRYYWKKIWWTIRHVSLCQVFQVYYNDLLSRSFGCNVKLTLLMFRWTIRMMSLTNEPSGRHMEDVNASSNSKKPLLLPFI